MSDAFGPSNFDEAPAHDPRRGRRRLQIMAVVLLATVAIGYWGCAKPPFITLPSGLKYRILREGTGPKPGPHDSVLVYYDGWLDDGTVFESTFERRMQATVFGVGAVIPGWKEGLQLIGAGGKIELEIPPDLGYGKLGAPPKIPPNATLHFTLDVVEVHQNPNPPAAERNPAEKNSPQASSAPNADSTAKSPAHEQARQSLETSESE